MPSASSIDDAPAFNLGPLTSTWSAPASCITNGFNTALAMTVSPNEGPFILDMTECRGTVWDDMDECFPDGGEYMSIITEIENKPNPTYGAHYYHSPGLECPEGWFTAGEATMNSDGVEKTGTMFDFPTTLSIEDIGYKPYNRHFADALDAGETAIWCCPSGYSVNALGEMCYKTLDVEDVTVTNLCAEHIINSFTEKTATFTLDGTVVTRSNQYTWIGDRTMSTHVEEVTFGPDELEESELTPVVFYPMITMAHREGDSDEGGDEGDDNSEGGEGNGDNAASGLMSAGVMALVVGAAGILGAALVL